MSVVSPRPPSNDSAPLTAEEVSVELSSRRTGMSFQRTRLSADRTLMSVIRTSLSLISFGFTIFQFLGRLSPDTIPTGSARRFGFSLVLLGVVMLVLGIVYHLQFMTGLRHLRHDMATDGLIHGTSGFPTSLTLLTALVLLALGVAAVVSMVFQVGPFV